MIAVLGFNKSGDIILLSEISGFADVFSIESAGKLPEIKAGDYAIDLEPGKEPLYSPIYSLLNTELAELRRYLDKALGKG